jgi:hypothetical protein
MNQLDEYQFGQLTNQAECYIHKHPLIPLDQASQAQLEEASPVKPITSATYQLTAFDEQISVAQTCTVTLPPAAKGKEYHITLIVAGATLTIVPTAPDTVLGTTDIVVTVQWTSLHLKADTANNWIVI